MNTGEAWERAFQKEGTTRNYERVLIYFEKWHQLGAAAKEEQLEIKLERCWEQ